jgi:hypothetical protein
MTQPKKSGISSVQIVFLIVALAVVLCGVWVLLSRTKKYNIVNPFDLISGNKGGEEKTVENPITGVLYTTKDAEVWKDKRPIGVMVNNHYLARPQSGLDKADLVYEMVAEAGITRYSAFFLSESPVKVGPIRSIREYYLVLVKEMGDAMIMHIGWSPQALTAIETWPVRSLNRLGLNCDQALPDPTDTECWRNATRVNSEVPWEHTAYGNLALLRKKGEVGGWSGKPDVFTQWKFKDDQALYPTATTANSVNIDFWYHNEYSSSFTYDPASNSYLRFLGFDDNDIPTPHKDQETGVQLSVKNVIVQFATENTIAGDEKGRLSYELLGSGEAKVLLDGKVIDATWSKASRDARTVFYDLDGKELEFNRGKFWLCIVPDRNKSQVVFR